MDRKITIKELKKFKKQYHKNPANKIIENVITRVGIDEACFNHETLIENQNLFNIETSLGSVQNQRQSARCWCFAGTNLIRGNIAENMNVDIKDFNLSNVYISFYDRLEKFNNAYENLFTAENLDPDYLNEEEYFLSTEGGWYQTFATLVTKYGLVPSNYMPETHDSLSSNRLNILLQEKLKYDASIIIGLRKEKKSIEELREIKEKMLAEVYEILCKVLGEPPEEFTLEYKDKDKKIIRIENMTPIAFKEKYLTLDVNDFIVLRNLEHEKRKFYQIYQDKRIFLSLEKPRTYLNVPMDELKKVAIKQLKDNIPVWFACPANKMWNRKEWILDTRNYNYQDILGMKWMDKKTQNTFYELPASHAMSIVGVHLVENEPVRWKIEDSYGKDKGNSQFIIMNDNYFEEKTVYVAIHKKYLTKKMLDCLDQKPIIIGIHEM